MPLPNETDHSADLPRYLRRDPNKQRESMASRFNFSWISGMAQQLRSALNKENKVEEQKVCRQSESAKRFRESEMFARRSSQDHLSSSLRPSTATATSSESADTAGDLGKAATSSSANIDQSDSHLLESDREKENDDEEIDDVYDNDLDAYLDDDFDEEDLLASAYSRHSSTDQENEADRAPEDMDVEDAENLDAEELDADEVDADEFDAEDLDAEVLDTGELITETAPGSEEFDANPLAIEHTPSDQEVSAETGGRSDNGSAHSLADDSDHEAQEYEPELSSMSLWEGSGFQLYDSAMDVEYEGDSKSDAKDSEAEGSCESDSEQNLEPSANRYQTKTPEGTDIASPQLPARTNETEKSKHETFVMGRLPSSPPRTPLEAPRSAPRAGSRLEPSKRYVGFHFGPAESAKATMQPEIVGVTNEQSFLATEEHVVDVSHCHGDTSAQEVAQENQVSLGKEEDDPKSSGENPYAGLWNLFNVGFTVAPLASPNKKQASKGGDLGRRLRESETSLADEFQLLAQTAHRVMASSSLFGGAPPAPPRRHRDEIPLQLPESQDSTVFNKHVSGIAHNIFAHSPLFGGKSEEAAEPVLRNERALPASREESEEVGSHSSSQTTLGTSEANEAPPESASLQDSSTVRNADQGNAGETVQRRRLRNARRRVEFQESSEAKAKANANLDDEEPVPPSVTTSSETKKRKRIAQRTRPLTRAALRAQKEKEAAEDSQNTDSERRLERDPPRTKKRKSSDSQKSKSGRRTRENA